MKLVHENWYGFDHDAVKEQFGKDLRYMCDLCLDGDNFPVAVYYNETPDRSKNHKNFMLLHVVRDSLSPEGASACVRGKDLGEFSKNERYQDGVGCENCGDVIYSAQRHHCNHCSCEDVMIDGGKEYTRCSFDAKMVKIDLLTGLFVDDILT